MRYLVTGGGGFVGAALVRALRAAGHEVIALARQDYPALAQIGATCAHYDLTNGSAGMLPYFEGCDAVFHTAAKVDMWGDYQLFYEANVVGTRNVIEACKQAGVKKLIYTSSPSVVAGGANLCGVDESCPYPKKYLANYPQTKAAAEQEVLQSNTSDGLKTLALRPHLIWGPGDRHLIPTVVERARAGRLLRIGKGENLVDFTYIDDCVEAHLCALRALESSPSAAGRAYFISQGDPVPLWWWVDQILVMYGLPVITRSVPVKIAYGIAGLSEAVCNIIPGKPEPLFSRFLIKEMATSHYFNISAARKELGYNPAHSTRDRLAQFQNEQVNR